MIRHNCHEGANQDDDGAVHTKFPTVVDGDGSSSAGSCRILLIPSQPDTKAQEIVESSTNRDERFCNKVCCQVEIHYFGPPTKSDSDRTILLYSRDSEGNRKSTGGDEFYIRYEERIIEQSNEGGGTDGDGQNRNNNDHISGSRLLLQAVALITDRNDGSYVLDFCTTPMHPNQPSNQDFVAVATTTKASIQQTVTVYFDYTNGIGSLSPPTKDEWENGGYTHTVYHHHFLSSPLHESVNDDSLLHHHHHHYDVVLARRPKIRTFRRPTMTISPSSNALEKTCCDPRDGNINNDIDLGQFDQVFVFGDSTFCQLVRQRPNKNGKYYFHPNLCVGEKVRVGLHSSTTAILLSQLDDQLGQYLSSTSSSSSFRVTNDIIGDENDVVTMTTNNNNTTKTTRKKKTKIALIVGSCLWDILDSQSTGQGTNYEDHARACEEYITSIRQRYPTVTVIWKLPMAVHIHWVDLQRVVDHDKVTATLFGINRIKYMSESRSKFLYMVQKHLMAHWNVPCLDLYEATYLSADWLYPSDGRHYKPDLNRRMLNWFYRPSGDADDVDGSNHNNENATTIAVQPEKGEKIPKLPKYFQQVVP
jgi:hypothetical protein